MNRASRLALLAGTVLLALGVIAGAFGSHALATRLEPARLAIWHTGVLYHLVHGLGLVLLGLLADRLQGTRLPQVAIALMVAGIIAFSGSLYLLALEAPRMLAALAPVGGSALILAWLLAAVAVVRSNRT
jgi:uncharacterized membrane protein YgdD (TMEM256/DUF423 family)